MASDRGEEVNVNFTPGEVCRINDPGFFRLCVKPLKLGRR